MNSMRSGKVSAFKPERRFYDKAEEANSEVAIGSTWKEDVYFTLAGWEQNGQVSAIQAIVNPLVSWIWTGGIVMAAGAIFCLLPRLIPHHVAEPMAAKPAVPGRLVLPTPR